MKICVSVKGRFHAYQLARQLIHHGLLKQLYTTFPRCYVKQFGIAQQYIKSFPLLEVVARTDQYFPVVLKKLCNSNVLSLKYFDALVAKQIKLPLDLFVGWSGGSLKSIKRAKQVGAMAIVERGSTHILYQQQVLTELYQQQGICKQVVHPEIVERELVEYVIADKISIPSNFVKQTFIQHGINAEKLIVTPYGVDLSCFKPCPKEDKVFRIIFSGSACFRKGAHLLLQAFSELNLPNAELWFIGSIAPELITTIKKYADKRVFFKGPFREAELAAYYSQGSLFCLPTFEEGLAMVIPQAMACGLPILTTKASGADELIQDSREGMILDTNTLETLKEGIEWFYDNKTLAEDMAQCGMQRAVHHTWERYGVTMMDHYNQLLTPELSQVR